MTCAWCSGCPTTTWPSGCRRRSATRSRRSVPYLAAPAFAAAMLEHQVLRTIPVGRHVLLIADVGVSAGSELAGQPVRERAPPGAVRVIALRRATAGGVDWSPDPGYRLRPLDRIYVLATRAGLSRGAGPLPGPRIPDASVSICGNLGLPPEGIPGVTLMAYLPSGSGEPPVKRGRSALATAYLCPVRLARPPARSPQPAPSPSGASSREEATAGASTRTECTSAPRQWPSPQCPVSPTQRRSGWPPSR